MSYTGWTLYDNVTIVTKEKFLIDKIPQGYVVDPTNKSQKETAQRWARGYNSYFFTYQNEGFELELCKSARGSTAGGALSFWDCIVTAPDGNKFLIGIDAELLLNLIKNNTFIDGKLQGTFSFARLQGCVGALTTSMEDYKTAIADKQAKEALKKARKTTKWQVGHVYQTLTCKDVYLGRLYRWYKPIYKNQWAYSSEIYGFKKLKEPEIVEWYSNYYPDHKSLNNYCLYGYDLHDKCPAREEASFLSYNNVEFDVEKKIQKLLLESISGTHAGLFGIDWYNLNLLLGLTTNKDEYIIPYAVAEAIKAANVKLVEE